MRNVVVLAAVVVTLVSSGCRTLGFSETKTNREVSGGSYCFGDRADADYHSGVLNQLSAQNNSVRVVGTVETLEPDLYNERVGSCPAGLNYMVTARVYYTDRAANVDGAIELVHLVYSSAAGCREARDILSRYSSKDVCFSMGCEANNVGIPSVMLVGCGLPRQ